MKLGGMHTVTFPFSLSSFQPQQKDIKRRQFYCCNYYWSNIYILMSIPRNSLISQPGSVPHRRPYIIAKSTGYSNWLVLGPMCGEGKYTILTDNPIVLWNGVIRYKRKREKCWGFKINIWQLHFTLQSSSIYVHCLMNTITEYVYLLK